MTLDLIIFEAGDSIFALNLDTVSRINTIPKITPIAGANSIIEGMTSFESTILHVISLRSLVNQERCANELLSTFNDLIKQHHDWHDGLKATVETQVPFNGALNAHYCNLGKWIDSFTSYDDTVSSIIRKLNSNHIKLHNLGADTIEMIENEKIEEANNLLINELDPVFAKTMGAMEELKSSHELVADSLQKLLLYRNEEEHFAIKVDKIIDIVHIEENEINQSHDSSSAGSEFINYSGVLELNETLINVIKTIHLPK